MPKSRQAIRILGFMCFVALRTSDSSYFVLESLFSYANLFVSNTG